MKAIIISSILFFISCNAFGQDRLASEEIAKNTIYGEAFGQGFAYSLNYDRLLNTNRRFMNSFTVGATFIPQTAGFGDGIYMGIPVSYNWILGRKSHHLELGVGVTPMFVKSRYWPSSGRFYFYASPKISYRFQRPQDGLFFRVTATGFIDLFHLQKDNLGGASRFSVSTMNDVLGLDYPVFPWPGLSIGYTFK